MFKIRGETTSQGISLVAQLVKSLSAMQETWLQFLGWEDPLEKETATHSLPGESHGQRNLAGYSLGSQESDTTERRNTRTRLNISVFLNVKVATKIITL